MLIIGESGLEGKTESLKFYFITLIAMVFVFDIGKIICSLVSNKDTSKSKLLISCSHIITLFSCFLMAQASKQKELQSAYS